MKAFDEMDWYDIYRTAWSGARDTVEKIEDEGKGDEFVSLIEELYPEGIDRTSLNDLLWFDDEWVFESLGIKEEEESEDDE